jgi:DNA-directed RNA polymerase specialized sigma24 family protein
VTGFDYEHWLKVARQLSRRADEAADLLHDGIVEAVRAGREDFRDEPNQRWFAGVLRNRAAMVARTAARRTRRETARREDASGGSSQSADGTTFAPPPAFIPSLPRAARAVATLVLAGLRREEILSALRLTDTAFRQRLTTIRKAWDARPPGQRALAEAPLHPRPDPHFQLGLIRRALLSCVKQQEAALGTHDPDGHLIVIDSAEIASQIQSRRQQAGGDNRK